MRWWKITPPILSSLGAKGFRKVDTDRWEFANDNFVRGQKHLLKNIRRRKHPHIADQPKALPQQGNCDESSQEATNYDLSKEVENLKLDKNSLMQELVKLRQHQESSENNLLLLSDRLQGMEKHQQQMLSFLVMVVQNPGFMVQLIHPKENNWRLSEQGNMLGQGKQDDKPVASEGLIIKYIPPASETPKPVVPLSPAFDKQTEPELSVDGLKDLCISSEFLKVLLDEKLCPLENHTPFILPDLPDDSSWEQLFLGSPFLGNIKDSNRENEEPTISGMEMEPTISETQKKNLKTFEAMIVEMEKTQE
ncbi:heat stress transcription factor A-8 isoform X2 [Gastrolobium bilobum]|uniref:heat stress transcription factor A-8 isoform X2 n=1 Tax=Gastrolobium bilobum TaxID=150636 RepID=UPI002AAFD4A7|nr:heat stress transcription factor A-8 isoform X2 [Gastrolobium bilobum]